MHDIPLCCFKVHLPCFRTSDFPCNLFFHLLAYLILEICLSLRILDKDLADGHTAAHYVLELFRVGSSLPLSLLSSHLTVLQNTFNKHVAHHLTDVLTEFAILQGTLFAHLIWRKRGQWKVWYTHPMARSFGLTVLLIYILLLWPHRLPMGWYILFDFVELGIDGVINRWLCVHASWMQFPFLRVCDPILFHCLLLPHVPLLDLIPEGCRNPVMHFPDEGIH